MMRLGISKLCAGLLAALLAVAPFRTAAAVCETPKDASIDFYILLDLSWMRDKAWIATLARMFLNSCRNGDTVTLIGFNASAAPMTDRLACPPEDDLIEQVLTEIVRFDRPDGQRRTRELIASRWPALAGGVALLAEGRLKTDFRVLSKPVRELVTNHSRSPAGHQAGPINPEHQNRVVALITDGIPDPEGHFPSTVWTRSEVDTWLREIQRYGEADKAVGGLKEICLNCPSEIRIPNEPGQVTVEVGVSVWVGSESFCERQDFCKETADLQFRDASPLARVSRALCRLWEIEGPAEGRFAVCPESLNDASNETSIKKAIEDYVRSIRAPRHIHIEGLDVSQWSHHRPLRLALKITSHYLSTHTFAEGDFWAKAQFPPGKNDEVGLTELSVKDDSGEHQIRPGISQLHVTTVVPESLPRDVPGRILVGVTDRACDSLRFNPLVIDTYLPPRRGIQINLDDDRPMTETIWSHARVPLHVDNPYPFCLAVQPWLKDQLGTQIRVDPACKVVQGWDPQTFAPYSELVQLGLTIERPGVYDIELGFTVNRAEQCQCNENLGDPLDSEIGNLHLKVTYLPLGGFTLCLGFALLGAMLTGLVLFNRVFLRSPGRSVVMMGYGALGMVVLSLATLFWAFNGFHGWRPADFHGLLLVGALVLLVAAQSGLPPELKGLLKKVILHLSHLTHWLGE